MRPGKDLRHGWLIVVAVTLAHLGILGWAQYGAARPSPRKSEITIELGSPPARASGGPGQPQAPAADAPSVRKATVAALPPLAQSVQQPPAKPLPSPTHGPAPSDPEQIASPQVSAAPIAQAAPPGPAAPAPVTPTQAATATPLTAPMAIAGGGGGASATGTYQPVGYLNNPKPPYPRMAMLQGVEGTVRLQVLVQADGSASQVLLAQSSGSELLDKSALETVLRWKFTPARSQGKETAQWVSLPITFSLTRR